MSLNRKILFLIILIVVIVSGMSAISFYNSYTRLNDVINSTGSSFIKRSAVMIDLFFDQFRAMARDVGNFYVMLGENGALTKGDMGETDEREFAKYLVRFLKENEPYGIANIFLVSAKTGSVLDGTGWRDADRTDYREHEWYREGMASDRVVLGNPYKDPITGLGVFNTMYKVEDKNGNPLGLLGIVVKVDDVRDLVHSQRLSDVEEGYPIFLDGEGYLWNDVPWMPEASKNAPVWGSDKITMPSGVIPGDLAALGKKMVLRQEGWGDFQADGRQWRVFYAPSKNAHLIVGYLFPKELLGNRLMHLVLFSIASAGGTIGLILFVLVPVSGNLRHTVQKIEHTARAIKATFAPPEENSAPDTTEEFFRQERIDRMAMSLQSIMDEFQEQIRHTNFKEFREILGGIHSTLAVVAEQQADLTAHAEEIMAINSNMKHINAQLARRELVWSSLLEITQSITSTLNFHVALERVVDAVKNVTQAYGIGILIVEEDELVPLIFSGYQNAKNDLEKYRTSLDSVSLATRAVRTHAVQWVEDVHSDEEYREIDKNVRSQVEFPLYQGEQILGVMMVSFDKRYRQSEEFLTTMAPVGASLSGYLNTWKAHKEIRSSYEYLMQKFQEIADIYHHETASHLVRVGRYSAMAAAWLGCTLQEQQDIQIFSRAHDLGKIRVPVEIVIKPSGLTLEEFEVMKQHTIWGADLIGSAEWLKMARNICLNHHERWDGTGYPHGLKGKAISREGRIVSLVDVYDALRSPRSYKKGYDHEQTVDIIVNGDGRTLPQHFDPDLLEFFKRNHGEMSRIFNETEED
ncbi:MAG: HD domain-containing protein [Synergistaceae bacterium]|jgi:HD-GYP domain-containing protein (c-di-GMP phosphodiesterase class II)|nr:HD domain-containing protein [Synergistaceae bacterium]